jgi:two-component system chemotaxis response regulator CheY
MSTMEITKPSTVTEEPVVTLPRRDGASAEERFPRLETVLLIEDDRDLSRALTLRLQRAGLTVARAYDGPTGLERFRLLEPDLIILDLGLPRMDGAKFMHFLRMTPGIKAAPIIVITGSSNASLIHKAEHWGVTKILRKPISPRELVETTLDTLEGV